VGRRWPNGLAESPPIKHRTTAMKTRFRRGDMTLMNLSVCFWPTS